MLRRPPVSTRTGTLFPAPPLFRALAAGAGLAVLALAMRPAADEAQGGSSPAPSPELTSQCASCHALTRPADTTVEHLWNRKGPDLWYAGDKFNREDRKSTRLNSSH